MVNGAADEALAGFVTATLDGTVINGSADEALASFITAALGSIPSGRSGVASDAEASTVVSTPSSRDGISNDIGSALSSFFTAPNLQASSVNPYKNPDGTDRHADFYSQRDDGYARLGDGPPQRIYYTPAGYANTIPLVVRTDDKDGNGRLSTAEQLEIFLRGDVDSFTAYYGEDQTPFGEVPRGVAFEWRTAADGSRSIVYGTVGIDFSRTSLSQQGTFFGIDPNGALAFRTEPEWSELTHIKGIESVLADDPVSGELLSGIARAVDSFASSTLDWANPTGPDAISPLALDLNADGEVSTTSAQVSFDTNGDGTKERVRGWISGEDAWLAFDRNGNGAIDSRLELFGDLDRGQGKLNDGYADLALLDANGDGYIRVDDTLEGVPLLDTLLVWQDADADGVSDAGETQTLREAGVSEIYTGTVRYGEDYLQNQDSNLTYHAAKDNAGAFIGVSGGEAVIHGQRVATADVFFTTAG